MPKESNKKKKVKTNHRWFASENNKCFPVPKTAATPVIGKKLLVHLPNGHLVRFKIKSMRQEVVVRGNNTREIVCWIIKPCRTFVVGAERMDSGLIQEGLEQWEEWENTLTDIETVVASMRKGR